VEDLSFLDRFASDRQVANTLASQFGNSVGQSWHDGSGDRFTNTAGLL
jgi:hypothetical protein